MHPCTQTVIRYCLMLTLVMYVLLPSPAVAQKAGPVINAVQQGSKTVMMLSGNWTADAASAELTLFSSSAITGAAASRQWQLSSQQHESNDEDDDKNGSVSFMLSSHDDTGNNDDNNNDNNNSGSNGSTDDPDTSIFAVLTNSTAPTFQYRLAIDSVKYSGAIVPENNSGGTWFTAWKDSREGAMSAYLPDGWKADLQIIRPYAAMTGFVFFVRGEANTLAYVFYPFMPLHLLPDDSVCLAMDTCDGIAPAEVVSRASFGNAPVYVSELKDPKQYFETEVLPLLRRNLDGYSVESSSPLYALRYDGNNNVTSSEFLNGLEVNYGFDAQGKKVAGRATVLMSNHTSEGMGFWNGAVMGVESAETGFDDAFVKASVTLLTLKLDENWKEKEQSVLYSGAASSIPALRNVTNMIANASLSDFDSVVSTAAHALVRSYKDAEIGAFANTEKNSEERGEKEEKENQQHQEQPLMLLHLPIYESTHNWYLDDGKLLGRKVGRNLMNDTTIMPLFG